MSKKRVVHYLNQFYGGIGGEDKADFKPEARDGHVGPGMALKAELGGEVEIVGTVICGDTYFGENIEAASKQVLDLIKGFSPDMVIAGPAFNAGRYGVACGAVAKIVSEELNIPVVSGMYPENPGAEIYRTFAYIAETTNAATGMKKAIPVMAKLVLKLAKGEEFGTPEEEGYIPRGIRKNYFEKERGSKRAVEMLVRKIKGEPFVTEYPMPSFDRVMPNAQVKDMSKAKVALVTSGGIVPYGNPDRIESSSASKYGKYDLSKIEKLGPDNSQTAHGGYDPVYANANTNRVLPLDVMRDLVKEGVIGELHNYWYATVGNGTSVANAKAYASEIAQELKEANVQAVILTST